jgi:hypothetical protein
MLFKLLTAPLMAPVSGFTFILAQLRDLAERELYDTDRIREELLLLQLRFEQGEIPQDEFEAQEKEILARLRAVRELQQKAASEQSES